MRKHSAILKTVVTLAFVANAAMTFAADPATLSFASTERATEASTANATLPAGAASSLIVVPCPGCAPLTFRATSATTYFLRKQKVTLGELKAAIGGRSVALTVLSSTKTHELTRIVADLDAPVPTPTPTPTRPPARAPARK